MDKDTIKQLIELFVEVDAEKQVKKAIKLKFNDEDDDEVKAYIQGLEEGAKLVSRTYMATLKSVLMLTEDLES